MSLSTVAISCLLVATLLALSISLIAGAPSSLTADASASDAKVRYSAQHSAAYRQSDPASATDSAASSLIQQPSQTAVTDEPVISTTFIALLLENINETAPIPFHAAVRVPRSSSGSRQHYCGNVLKDVLKMICRGKYNNGTQTRQSTLLGENSVTLVEAVPLADGAPVASPVDLTSSLIAGAENLGHATASSADKPKSRNVRGVVDECCRKPCTINDLRMYCMAD